MLAFIFENVGFFEWIILLVVFMIVFGPKKIPQTARTLGNYYNKIRRMADNFKRQLLEMETEFNKVAAEAEKQVEEVAKDEPFKSEGDESQASPYEDGYYGGDNPYPGYTDMDYDKELNDSALNGDPEVASSTVAERDQSASVAADSSEKSTEVANVVVEVSTDKLASKGAEAEKEV